MIDEKAIEELIKKYQNSIIINDLVYKMLDDYDKATIATLEEVISDLTNLLKQNQ